MTAAHSSEIVLNSAEQVEAFYRARDNQPVWTHGLRIAGRIAGFLTFLEETANEGLHPDEFHVSELNHLLQTTDEWASAQDQAYLELLLTDAYFTLGLRLAGLKVDPASMHEKWLSSPREDDPVALLGEALAGAGDPIQALTAQRPVDPFYKKLCAALVRYRSLEAIGGWAPVPDGPTLHPGDKDSSVVDLRHRLAVEDEAVSGEVDEPLEFDDDLVQAVRRFQRRHGLARDGIVGAATRSALNVTAAERVVQITLNLERLRWWRLDPDERSIRVNIPSFKLTVLDNGEEVLSMRAVVGRSDRPTPVLSGAVTYLELNPTWTIPQKLFREDLLPKILHDPNYLTDRQIRVYQNWLPGAPELEPATVAWDAENPMNMAYKLLQEPGPKNPLGRVKFMFSNPYSVYLHDTPGRSKFRRAERCFSSGCVRLEDPFALATFLLDGRKSGDPESLQEALATGEITRLGLPRSVPVHMIYQTAWADSQGAVHFRNDVYGYDVALEMALAELQSGKDVLPGADGPGVQMHELLAGIIADTAGAQVEGGASQIVMIDVGQAQINSAAGEMETLAGGFVAGAAEGFVGLGGTIAGNDLDGLAAPTISGQGVDLVEQGRVDGAHLIGSMISQDLVDGGQGGGNIQAVGPIYAPHALPGVDVLQGNNALGLGYRAGQGPYGPRY